MKRLLTILLLSSSALFGSISQVVVWEMRTTGSDTNGGGFVATGTDMSQFDNKNAAGCTSCQSATVNISVTNGATNGSTTITSATANFSSALVGNVIHVQGGTGSVVSNWYQVASVTNSTTVVVDRSTGLTTGTGVTIDIGGALATPGGLSYVLSASAATTGGYVYVKVGTYIQTSATNTVSGGVYAPGDPTDIAMVGYNTTRTDQSAAPTFKLNAGVTSTVMMRASSGGFYNLILDCNNQTSSTGLWGFGAYLLYGSTIQNCTNRALDRFSDVGSTYYSSFIHNHGAGGFFGTTCFYCYGNDNTGGPGFQLTVCSYCISVNGTGTLSNGIDFNNGLSATGHCDHCIAYNNEKIGIHCSGECFITNSIAEANGLQGFASSTPPSMFLNNGVYNNCAGVCGGAQTGALTNLTKNLITGTGSFFANAAGGNFALNNNVGAGASLLNAGFPGAWAGGIASTTYSNIGAIQAAASAGTGISASVH